MRELGEGHGPQLDGGWGVRGVSRGGKDRSGPHLERVPELLPGSWEAVRVASESNAATRSPKFPFLRFGAKLPLELRQGLRLNVRCGREVMAVCREGERRESPRITVLWRWRCAAHAGGRLSDRGPLVSGLAGH